jgi:dipeptidyl aminopeptidase/acylaminoacyl peptidase
MSRFPRSVVPASFLVLAVACAAPPPALPRFAAKPGPLTIDELLELPSVVEPILAPDGSWVAFVVNEPTLKPGGRTKGTLWLVKPDGSGAPQAAANAPLNPSSLTWFEDSKAILCVSAQSGSPQAWRVPVDGSASKQLTDLATGVSAPIASRDGRRLAFSSDAPRADRPADALDAKVIDDLLFRHWIEWRDNTRTHTYVQDLESGEARRVSAREYDAPGFSLGGPLPYAFSPDGKTLYYTQGAERDEALSTDYNLYSVDAASGGIPKRLTSNPGWDGSPVPSPNGKYLAFRSQKTPGFESDRFTIQLMDLTTGAVDGIGADIDRWIDEMVWDADSKSLVVGTEDEGTRAVWRVPVPGGASQRIYRGNLSGLSVSPDGAYVVGRHMTLRRSGEAARLDMKSRQLTFVTKVNDEFFSVKSIGAAESVWFEGAKGVPGAKEGKIQGWLVKPPGYKVGTRYPFLLMVHGGPQQAWLDNFGGSMWNPQIFAAHGYVVLALNPHGSTGFGQDFTNQISGDWGGAVHEDCMRACDWAVSEGLADPRRMGAFGGSFGGYMVNWFLGHTDRFQAIVSHAGVYNLDSMWGVTEELWFPEWDLKGRPWDSSQYQDRSPHKYARNFKTPTLVTHGELDYRVPIGEGIQLFQTLKRLGVPARFLYYPDEGHWLLKARNRELWIREVLAWFDKYVKQVK